MLARLFGSKYKKTSKSENFGIVSTSSESETINNSTDNYLPDYIKYLSIINSKNDSNMMKKYIEKLNNEKIILIFKRNNELFRLFDCKSCTEYQDESPYSEYEFMKGIEQSSQLTTEQHTSIAISIKGLALLALSVPKFSFIVFAGVTFSSGGTAGAIGAGLLFAHLCLRFAFDIIRQIKRKFKKSIILCTKYYPFIGFESYLSKINEIYHKIFYYNEYQSESTKFDDFFYSACGFKNNDDDFISQVFLICDFLDEYIINLREKANRPTILNQPNLLKIQGVQKKVQKNVLNNIVQIPQPTIPFNNQGGGSSFDTMINNTNPKIRKIKKKKFTEKIVEYFKTSFMSKVVVRLNFSYEINGNTFLLKSGDITIEKLYSELFELINSRATYFKGESSVASLKIPFFVDDFLIDLLYNLFSLCNSCPNIDILKLSIIIYIHSYINTFKQLYLIAKSKIYTMLKNNFDKENLDDALLEEMFKVNLSYTAMGRYSSNTTKEAKFRDKLNYYCILAKYCILSIDHIIKKFKISIVEDKDLYNKIKKYEEIQEEAYLTYMKILLFNYNPNNPEKFKEYQKYLLNKFNQIYKYISQQAGKLSRGEISTLFDKVLQNQELDNAIEQLINPYKKIRNNNIKSREEIQIQKINKNTANSIIKNLKRKIEETSNFDIVSYIKNLIDNKKISKEISNIIAIQLSINQKITKNQRNELIEYSK